MKAQGFLESIDHNIQETVDASKVRLGRDEALKLAKKASRVIAAKGKKITTFDLKKGKPDDEALLQILLGPTGNLRAPALLVNDTLLVGFNEESYSLLGS